MENIMTIEEIEARQGYKEFQKVFKYYMSGLEFDINNLLKERDYIEGFICVYEWLHFIVNVWYTYEYGECTHNKAYGIITFKSVEEVESLISLFDTGFINDDTIESIVYHLHIQYDTGENKSFREAQEFCYFGHCMMRDPKCRLEQCELEYPIWGLLVLEREFKESMKLLVQGAGQNGLTNWQKSLTVIDDNALKLPLMDITNRIQGE